MDQPTALGKGIHDRITHPFIIKVLGRRQVS
jgi:hypothetical protein